MRTAAVAIIVNVDKVLMGLAASDDFRYGKWCFVGGGIDGDETPYQTAVRESSEEAGIVVTARPGEAYIEESRPNIVYVVCDYVSGNPIPNEEFFELGWFKIGRIPEGMNILPLNLKIIEKLL